jgi:hypothetical protein
MCRDNSLCRQCCCCAFGNDCMLTCSGVITRDPCTWEGVRAWRDDEDVDAEQLVAQEHLFLVLHPKVLQLRGDTFTHLPPAGVTCVLLRGQRSRAPLSEGVAQQLVQTWVLTQALQTCTGVCMCILHNQAVARCRPCWLR